MNNNKRPNINGEQVYTKTFNELFPNFSVWRQQLASYTDMDVADIDDKDFALIKAAYGKLYMLSDDPLICYSLIATIWGERYSQYKKSKDWNETSLKDMMQMTADARQGIYALARNATNNMTNQNIKDLTAEELEKYLATFSQNTTSMTNAYANKIKELDEHFQHLYRKSPKLRLFGNFINDVALMPQPAPRTDDTTINTVYALIDLGNVGAFVNAISADPNNSIALGSDGKLFFSQKVLEQAIAQNGILIASNSQLIRTNQNNIIGLDDLLNTQVKPPTPIEPTITGNNTIYSYDLSSFSSVDFSKTGSEFKVNIGNPEENDVQFVEFIVDTRFSPFNFQGEQAASTFDKQTKILKITSLGGQFVQTLAKLTLLTTRGGTGVVGADKVFDNLNLPTALLNIISSASDNILGIGPDNKLTTPATKPADLISSQVSNQLVLGSDGKLFINTPFPDVYSKVADETNFLWILDAKEWSGVIDTFTDGKYRLTYYETVAREVKSCEVDFTIANNDVNASDLKWFYREGNVGIYNFKKTGLNTYALARKVQGSGQLNNVDSSADTFDIFRVRGN